MSRGWERPNCPICETGKYFREFYAKVVSWEFPGQFDFLKCGNCGMIVQSPRETFDKVSKYYPVNTYWGTDINQLSAQKHYGPIYAEVFKRYKNGLILDVGCGLGLFLSEFKKRGWRVLGTEISKHVAEIARKKFKVRVFIGELEDLNFNDQFDVISFIGVFEHIYNPSKTLGLVKKLLKDDGLLVIVPPNFDSLARLMFRENWYSLEPGRHIYHYTPDTIGKLLDRHGFKVESIKHNHWEYNRYGLFTSFRYYFSPKYRKLKKSKIEDLKISKVNLIKQFGVLAGAVFAWLGAAVEPLIGRGESMLVYVKKA